ncbi:ParB/RepB/Spo0J family partition protein [Thermoactinospora rubra]|uniref:ParB/RepB/Spo0J family partition protein n=1 Tax=Thermoactinospora rubra TaxID=1088767 RepID=UPI000A0F4AB3|nr:ParB/RepB/Spo0J family partition protein [Thermoactinospora rubra]
MSFDRVTKVRLDRLVIGTQQARSREVEDDIAELADNIRVHGQLEPIIVTPSEDRDGYYEILAGQRRWLAMRRLGARDILAAIVEERPDDDVAKALSISENLVRRDLCTLDLIDACTRLYHKYGSIKAVAETFGLPYGRVRKYVKFDRLRPTLKALVESGEIDLGAALRIQDHYGDKPLGDQELRQIAAAMAGMSAAQQMDYLRTAEVTAHQMPAADGGNGKRRPGAVKQIIVTLSIADLEALRAWARAKNLTQDRAGARIIAAFLRSSANQSAMANGHQERGTALRPADDFKTNLD